MALVPQFEPLTAVNLRKQVEDQILSAILTGMFRPGQRLKEVVIAEQLGVSRAPVREALSSLEHEGIIVSNPRRGYSIIAFTERDIDEIYSLRLLLETEALRRSIDRYSKQNLRSMQSILDKLGYAVQRGTDLERIISLDFQFHEQICRVANHTRLYAAWNSMRLQTLLLIGITTRTHYDYPEQPKALHQGILDAIIARDIRLAEPLLAAHIQDAQQRAMTALRDMLAQEAARSPS